MKKNKMFWLTRSKVMPLISEREIATDNGMWLIYPSHLEKVLDCQKKKEEKIKQSSSSRAKAKIFNILNKPNFPLTPPHQWEIDACMRLLSFFID